MTYSEQTRSWCRRETDRVRFLREMMYGDPRREFVLSVRHRPVLSESPWRCHYGARPGRAGPRVRATWPPVSAFLPGPIEGRFTARNPAVDVHGRVAVTRTVR